MATAKRLPSGSWRCRVWYSGPDGKRHSESFTAPTKKEAERKAAEFDTLRLYYSDARNRTLRDIINEYIDSKRHALSPTTLQGYEKIRDQNFQTIMDLPLKKITQQVMSKAIQDELERKPNHRNAKTMSVKSVKNAYGLISPAIRRADPSMVFQVDFPKQARKIRTLPTPEQIYEAVRGSDIELPVLLAMWLSFTESEMRGLTKSRSIDGDYITIREVMVMVDGVDVKKDMAKEETRNRRHKIPPYIKELIDKVDGDVIVPQSPSVLLKTLKRLMKAADLPEITFHDLRHVNASLMAMLRIPDKYAQERGGWKTDHIMKTVYTETFSEERIRIDRIIDDHFSDIVAPQNAPRPLEIDDIPYF